jgi:hypothetical protein
MVKLLFMKLEHYKQKVPPFSHFLVRLGRYMLFCLLLIAVSVGLGTVGYFHYAKLSWLDSFYMSCMILTGMGPTQSLDGTPAKVFASFYALYSGIAFLSITAVFFAPVIHRVLHILHVEEK